MAAWTGARKGGGHGSWPSCPTAAAQGQAEAAEVTATCTQAGGRIQKGQVSRPALWGGHLVPWLSLHMGFLLWLGATVPGSRLGIVLAACSCEEGADGKGRDILGT